MKSWIVEEIVKVTHFHRVFAETEDEAYDKFINGDVTYDIKNAEYDHEVENYIYEEDYVD